jgi:hypothetical protein
MATSRKTPAKKTAAKKTSARGRKSNVNRWAGVQLPDGFTPITAGEYGDPWDFEENPVITGVVSGEIREVETGKGRDRRLSKVITIEEDDTAHRYDVWESAALRSWFDQLADGMRVSVAFQGYRDTGKASPMKVFVGAIAEGEYVTEPAKVSRKVAAKKTRR